ncbi:hypothetical protein C8R42DRAFT_655730 [Lentinula raphanica]|nr:hypothetical protein C8R42DRAFT_655730 [Lentinula raphanica]
MRRLLALLQHLTFGYLSNAKSVLDTTLLYIHPSNEPSGCLLLLFRPTSAHRQRYPSPVRLSSRTRSSLHLSKPVRHAWGPLV